MTSFWRPWRRTPCPTWTSPSSTPPAPSCAACGAQATAPHTSPCWSASAPSLPGAAVRSTFITGFPGETDAEFEELVGFVREAGLAVAGVFVYDEQEGTAAAGMPGAVPAELALERAAILGEVIDREAERFWSGLAGVTVDVLVERGTSRADGTAVGRIALQAPDVDGRTTLTRRPRAQRRPRPRRRARQPRV